MGLVSRGGRAHAPKYLPEISQKGGSWREHGPNGMLPLLVNTSRGEGLAGRGVGGSEAGARGKRGGGSEEAR